MARYINADEMIADTENMKTVADSISIDGIIKYIEEHATADVQEVKHGKWSRGFESKGAVCAYAYCSACNRKMNDYCYGYLHCPMCGAIMDGK